MSNLTDKETVDEFYDSPDKKLTPEELKEFLDNIDASPQVKEVFRKYHTDEAYAKGFDDRVNEQAIRLCDKINERNKGN